MAGVPHDGISSGRPGREGGHDGAGPLTGGNAVESTGAEGMWTPDPLDANRGQDAAALLLSGVCAGKCPALVGDHLRSAHLATKIGSHSAPRIDTPRRGGVGL